MSDERPAAVSARWHQSWCLEVTCLCWATSGYLERHLALDVNEWTRCHHCRRAFGFTREGARALAAVIALRGDVDAAIPMALPHLRR